MKKIFAILVAAMLIMALAVNVFADEVVVFDNPAGEAFEDCANSWDFFGVGGVWGRVAAEALDVSMDDVKAYFADGYSFTFVYSGNPATWSDSEGAPCAVIDDDFDNSTVCTYTDLGDGTYEATVKLSDVAANSAKSVDEMTGFVIQTWTDDFKLISAKFTNGASAPAAEPEAEVDAEPEAPAAEPEAPAAEPAPAPAAPATGLALAVVPAVMALAAVAVSKKR